MAATAPPENVDDAIEQLASLLTSQGIAGDDSEETRRLLESLSAKLKELGAGDSSATPATSSPSPSGSGDDTMPAPSDTPSSAPSGGGRNGRGGRRAPVRMSTDDSGGEYMDVVDEDVGEEGEGEEARSGSPGASETRSVSRSSYTGSSGGGGGDDDADSGEGLQYREVRRGAPKPIDLWRVKHAEDPAARRARAASEPLTAERMSELIERLHDGPLVKRAEWMRAQRKKMAEEMKQLTFSPAVNRRSRQLAEGLGTLEDRLNAAVAARKFREAQVRQEHVEAAAAPFQPDTATPCVCGGGRGLVEAAAKGEDAEKVHTQYCLNFMRACEVSGGGRSRGARAWARDSQFLLKYEQLKAIRLEQRKAILKEMEDRDLTFKPQINESSAKLAQKHRERATQDATGTLTVGTAKSLGRAGAKSPAVAKPMPAWTECTFKPNVNARSRKWGSNARTSEDVHARLYMAATRQQRDLKRKQAQFAFSDAFVSPTPSAAPANPWNAPSFVNTVEYKPQYDFVVRAVLRGSR